jgi:hypothetical protein
MAINQNSSCCGCAFTTTEDLVAINIGMLAAIASEGPLALDALVNNLCEHHKKLFVRMRNEISSGLEQAAAQKSN